MAESYIPEYHPSMPGESAKTAGGKLVGETTKQSSSPDSPVISVQSRRVVCSCGSPTTLVCSVAGSPTPSVSWIREGGACQGSKYRCLAEAPLFYLFVADTSLEDAGEYSIVARNEQGESTLTIQVSILTPAPPDSE